MIEDTCSVVLGVTKHCGDTSLCRTDQYRALELVKPFWLDFKDRLTPGRAAAILSH